jgi:hypothetical protein
MPAAELWTAIGPLFVARLIGQFSRYRVARWVPDLRTEMLLGAIVETQVYLDEADPTAGHVDLDVHVGSFWDSPSAPTRILKVEIGIFDQQAGQPLLHGALWAQRGGSWFWEPLALDQLVFWLDPPGQGYR